MSDNKTKKLATDMANVLGATAPTKPEKPSTQRPAPKSRTMPTEQQKQPTYSARIELTTTPEQNRALEEARITDRIGKTARIRAMIALWERDERLRKRIDREAQNWR